MRFSILKATIGVALASATAMASGQNVAHQNQAEERADVRARSWMSHPDAIAAAKTGAPIALQFKRRLHLGSRPEKFVVHVSADSRYVLFVNGRRVAAGPSRGDLAHWRYERLDIASFLEAGDNMIAAQVWNDGVLAPRAQISAKTGFYILAEDPRNRAIDAGRSWVVRVDGSRGITAGMPHMIDQVGGTYYVAGNPEQHDGTRVAADWKKANSESTGWIASIDALEGSAAPWTLVEDTLPQMRYMAADGGRVVDSKNITATTFPLEPLTVPARSEVALLLDAGRVEAAYPELTMRGGAGAKVSLTYAEANYDGAKRRLSDRGQVSGGQVLGLTDEYRANGANHQSFQPFWWRTWRFAEIRIRTGDQPLILEGFQRHLTGYPFEQKAWFKSSDPELDRIWQIGWNTLKVDAHETFMDTAYWEQMQYVGDTRIEALLADLVSGDHRLSEQAIRQFDASREAHSFAMKPLFEPVPDLDGLPQAAWPSRQYQVIPPFALLWVGMIDDYRMRWPADALVRDMLPGVRQSVDWFTKHVGHDGLVGEIPGWRFLDWKPNLEGDPFARPTKDENGCVLSLMFLGALHEARDLEGAAGDAQRVSSYTALAERLGHSIQQQCWSPVRGLYADNAAKDRYSQHANLLAVLYDVAPRSRQAEIMERILLRGQGIDAPPGMTPVSYYFAFYLARALEHAGLADRYIELLGAWRAMLRQNFTTWPETPDPARSDTHAWSAHPTSDLLMLVAGIKPASAGFASVTIAPHLGPLTALSAGMPHARGMIETRYRLSGGNLTAEIQLPKGLAGRFLWSGQSRKLHSGRNIFTLADERASARGGATGEAGK